MRFRKRAGGSPVRLAVLPSAFHPPTRAHMALARAAVSSGEADEALLVLPAEFPHKRYETVDLEGRLELLERAASSHPRISIAVSDGGLFLDIARECRREYGAGVRIRFLCGRDAAERIVAWDYQGGVPIEKQLEEYELLVAPRDGVYTPPPELAGRISTLPLNEDLSGISSTAVRRRMREGESWRELVPEAIADRAAELYKL